VTGIGAGTVLTVFVIFCRVGGCLMLMAGISSGRVPMQVRLFLALALTLAIAPLVMDTVTPAIPDDQPLTVLRVAGFETLLGTLIGLIGRLFFLALQTLGHAMAMVAGFSMPGAPVEDTEALPSMTTLIMLTATLLFFITDQHALVLRTVVRSYSVLPVGVYDPQAGLIQMTDTLAVAFTLALRLASPFIIYGLAINMTLGILNKLTPSIPVYFISMPFVLAGGLMLLYLTSTEFQLLFSTGLTDWLASR
jgi:flagellar biosynthetic protein FliR